MLTSHNLLLLPSRMYFTSQLVKLNKMAAIAERTQYAYDLEDLVDIMEAICNDRKSLHGRCSGKALSDPFQAKRQRM